MAQILVVDDEPQTLHVLKFALERAGFTVQTCLSGAQALQAIRDSAPDALITDIQMSPLSGKELCLRIQAESPERQFPIFVMTSMTQREHREWTADIANLTFLEKPLSLRLLVQALHTHFPGRDTGASP